MTRPLADRIQHATTLQSRAPSAVATEQTSFFSGTSVSFTTVQLETSCINLVVIDDCRVADCPLVELSLSSLHLEQRQDGSGCLTSRLSASYYNRELSAWDGALGLHSRLDLHPAQQQDTEEHRHHQV